jgi:hypothetical protein
LTAVTDGGHVFSFGFMQTIIRLLAGMTDDQPKRGRPSDYSFQVAIDLRPACRGQKPSRHL